MDEKEFDEKWKKLMAHQKAEAEKKNQYFKEHPEALDELRHFLYDPFVQRISDTIADEPMIEFTIVGIRQTCGNDFEAVMGGIHVGGLLLLIPEPENHYDTNAIAVYNRDRKIGYVMASDIIRVEDSLCMSGYTECYVKRKYRNSIVAEVDSSYDEESAENEESVDSPYTERHDGPTPSGGDYSVAYYYNDDGPCTKEQATRVNIVEYTKKGKRINEVYGILGKIE